MKTRRITIETHDATMNCCGAIQKDTASVQSSCCGSIRQEESIKAGSYC